MESTKDGVGFPTTNFYGLSLKHDVAGLFATWKREKAWKEHCDRYPRFKELKQWQKQKGETLLREVYGEERAAVFAACSQQIYHEWWEEVSRDYHAVLEYVFSLRLKRKTSISAYMGISPVFPRFITDSSFLIPHVTNRLWLLQICAHEISHFYFYEKGEEMGLDTRKQYFWLASELVTPIILNDGNIMSLIGSTDRKTYACPDDGFLDVVELAYKEKYVGQISSTEMMLVVIDTAKKVLRKAK